MRLRRQHHRHSLRAQLAPSGILQVVFHRAPWHKRMLHRIKALLGY